MVQLRILCKIVRYEYERGLDSKKVTRRDSSLRHKILVTTLHTSHFTLHKFSCHKRLGVLPEHEH